MFNNLLIFTTTLNGRFSRNSKRTEIIRPIRTLYGCAKTFKRILGVSNIFLWSSIHSVCVYWDRLPSKSSVTITNRGFLSFSSRNYIICNLSYPHHSTLGVLLFQVPRFTKHTYYATDLSGKRHFLFNITGVYSIL